MQALGKPVRGPRAVEAETTALVRLREDIARDYGLLDDTTFPDKVRTAWDDLAKSVADLAAAEKSYYDARARARETWLGLSDAERAERAEPGDARPNVATTPSPAVTTSPPPAVKTSPPPAGTASSPAVTAWPAARDEVHLWQQRTDAAAADHHRLHLAAARMTAHYQSAGSDPGRPQKYSARPQEYKEPDWRSEAPEPYKITDAPSTGTGTDTGTAGSPSRTLTSPDGTTVREVYDVPHDGASFFHALLATAGARDRLP
ncbi:hypothetical protein GCM10010431_85910 [Streptomyces kunmingensis]